MQAMYDLVGDRIQEIFDAQVVDIGILDPETGHGPLPVHDRARRALPGRADRRSSGFRRHVLETREPLLIDERSTSGAPNRASRVVQGEPPKSVVFVPLIVGGEATGVISLQNLDREHAFSEATSSC